MERSSFSCRHPALLEKFRATFETYWNDPSFETYDPDRDRDRLDDALTAARGRPGLDRVTLSLSGLQVRPFPYQQVMLDALDAERRGPPPPPHPPPPANGTSENL